MEGDDWVLQEIWHVHMLPLSQHLWVFLLHEPADMSKKEASVGIMWVRIGFTEFMMYPVISYPIIKTILQVAFENLN